MNPPKYWAGHEIGIRQIRATKHSGSEQNTREKPPYPLQIVHDRQMTAGKEPLKCPCYVFRWIRGTWKFNWWVANRFCPEHWCPPVDTSWSRSYTGPESLAASCLGIILKKSCFGCGMGSGPNVLILNVHQIIMCLSSTQIVQCLLLCRQKQCVCRRDLKGLGAVGILPLCGDQRGLRQALNILFCSVAVRCLLSCPGEPHRAH